MAAVWVTTTRATTAASGARLASVGPRQPRQPDVGRTVVDRSEHGDTVRLEVERGDQRGGADQGDQCAGDPTIDAGTD